MSVKSALGWAALTGLLILASPFVLLALALKRLSGIQISMPSVSMKSVGKGLLWIAIGSGALVAVSLASLYAWNKFFPIPPEIKEVTVYVPVPETTGKLKLKSCLPITSGSTVKAKKHWSIPDGTRGKVLEPPTNACKENTAFRIRFDGSESVWCSDKDTFVPVDCAN